MKTESNIIRIAPSIELVFRETKFEIINSKDKKKAVYRYTLMKNIEFKKEKVNWLTTLLSFVVELFVVGSSFGKIYKEKRRLTFLYDNKPKDLVFINCDRDMTKKAIEVLASKL